MTTRVAISIINQKSSAKILQLHCHVRPGASKVREGVVAITDEAIELCVSARAQDGKANKGVLQVLSEALGAAKSEMQITHGLKSRDKTVSVAIAAFMSSQAGEVTDIVGFVREKLHLAASS